MVDLTTLMIYKFFATGGHLLSSRNASNARICLLDAGPAQFHEYKYLQSCYIIVAIVGDIHTMALLVSKSTHWLVIDMYMCRCTEVHYM